jgi:hypothetical protein
MVNQKFKNFMLIQFKGIILFLAISFSLFACSSNVKLIDKSRTEYGVIKFYSEKVTKQDLSTKRIYASIKAAGHISYYSFFPDEIHKTTDTAKDLSYNVYYKPIETDYDRNLYQRFSVTDSIVLNKGNHLLDSLGLHHFKTSKGASGFQIIVNYYHGYPKHKKFKP